MIPVVLYDLYYNKLHCLINALKDCSMGSVYIVKTAKFLPGKAVKNSEIDHYFSVFSTGHKIAKRITLQNNRIKERYYAVDPETKTMTHTNVDMTIRAIQGLEDESFRIKDMGLLACGTSSPDQVAPAHTTMVHGGLHTPSCEVAGISGICCAGVYALKYGYFSVASGEQECAVVTGSENFSSFMRDENFRHDFSESELDSIEKEPIKVFESAFLRWMLSDGAGAMLLRDKPAESGNSLKIEWIDVKSYAGEYDTCMYVGGKKQDDGRLKGWREFPSDPEALKDMFIFRQDVNLLNGNMSRIAIKEHLNEIVSKHGLSVENIDFFLPHLSSFYFKNEIHQYMQEINFEIPLAQWFTNLGYVGNIGAAALYVMLEELMNEGVPKIDADGEIVDRGERTPLKKGQKLLCGIPESGRFTSAFMLVTVV